MPARHDGANSHFLFIITKINNYAIKRKIDRFYGYFSETLKYYTLGCPLKKFFYQNQASFAGNGEKLKENTKKKNFCSEKYCAAMMVLFLNNTWRV